MSRFVHFRTLIAAMATLAAGCGTMDFFHREEIKATSTRPRLTETKVARTQAPEQKSKTEVASKTYESTYESTVKKEAQHAAPRPRPEVIVARTGPSQQTERPFGGAQDRPLPLANDGGVATAELLADIGYNFLLLGRLTEAEQALQESLAKNPRNSRAHINMGLVLGQQDKLQARSELVQRSAADVFDHLAQANSLPGASVTSASPGLQIHAEPGPSVGFRASPATELSANPATELRTSSSTEFRTGPSTEFWSIRRKQLVELPTRKIIEQTHLHPGSDNLRRPPAEDLDWGDRGTTELPPRPIFGPPSESRFTEASMPDRTEDGLSRNDGQRRRITPMTGARSYALPAWPDVVAPFEPVTEAGGARHELDQTANANPSQNLAEMRASSEMQASAADAASLSNPLPAAEDRNSERRDMERPAEVVTASHFNVEEPLQVAERPGMKERNAKQRDADQQSVEQPIVEVPEKTPVRRLVRPNRKSTRS